MKQLDSKSFWPILTLLVFLGLSYGETLLDFFPGLTAIDLIGFYLGAFVTGMLAGLHLRPRRRSVEVRTGNQRHGLAGDR